MKKRRFLFILAVTAVFAGQACNNSNSSKTNSTKQAEDINKQKEMVITDVPDFMVKAAEGGMTEVELGNLAQKNGKNPRVKAFGALMVRDHSKANSELKTLAASKNVTLPATMSDEHLKHFDAMKKLIGDEFDKHYMDMMVNDHKEDIDLFDEASKNSKDTEIKAFASRILPILTTHLDSAKAINDAIKTR